MSTRTVRINFRYNDMLTNADSVVLADIDDTYGVKRDDVIPGPGIVVVKDTPMVPVATGQYEYTFTEPAAGLTYTAWVKFIYGGNTYYEEVDLPAVITPALPALLGYSYADLVNDVGYHLFGLRPLAIDVITDAVASANQAADILRSIAKGLQYVYSAYRWSFLRPLVTITTYAPYTTGTITVDASGNVMGQTVAYTNATASGAFTVGESVTQATSLASGYCESLSAGVHTIRVLSGTFDATHAITGASSGCTLTPDGVGAHKVLTSLTIFPSYSASAGGWISIPSVGSWAVATYSSSTRLVLTDYTTSAVTAGTIYTLGFDTYPMPAGVDSLEGNLTYPQGTERPREYLDRVNEVEIRRMLARNNLPGRPRLYAETTKTFDPTVGSTRFITLFPVPNDQYTLTAVGTLRPTMIDATNQFPLGAEVLAPCIAESCLAASEREIEQKDAASPDAVHNRALIDLLKMAIRRDQEYASPDTLGVDHGQESHERYDHLHFRQTGGIYWSGGGGITGYI